MDIAAEAINFLRQQDAGLLILNARKRLLENATILEESPPRHFLMKRAHHRFPMSRAPAKTILNLRFLAKFLPIRVGGDTLSLIHI
jgi:hypothetical protein